MSVLWYWFPIGNEPEQVIIKFNCHVLSMNLEFAKKRKSHGVIPGNLGDHGRRRESSQEARGIVASR